MPRYTLTLLTEMERILIVFIRMSTVRKIKAIQTQNARTSAKIQTTTTSNKQCRLMHVCICMYFHLPTEETTHQ